MRISFFGVLLGILCSLQAAQSIDLNDLKRDTQIFEKIIQEILSRTFSNPFALEAEPQASYVRGFGVVVSFKVKINRATIRAPLGPIKAMTGSSRLSKKEQLSVIRETMIEALAKHADHIQQIGPDEQIAICAHVEDRNELDPNLSETIMVFSVTRADVERMARRELDFDEFKRRVTVLEY